MTLTLTSTEQARFAATARALLSPLDLPSVDAWRCLVLERLTALLEADAGGFILPAPGEAAYSLWHLPDSFAQEYFETLEAVETGRRVMREIGGGVWCNRFFAEYLGLEMPDAWYQSHEYRSFYSRYGVRDAIGFMAIPDRRPAGRGAAPLGPEAVLTCFSRRYGTEYFGDRGMELLRLLLPSLETGVAARMRLGGEQVRLEAAFDASAYGIAVYRVGQCQAAYRNGAFARIVDAVPESQPVRAALAAGVRSMFSLLRSPDGIPSDGLESASCEVSTPRARYRVRVSLLGDGVFGGEPAVLATLERLSGRRPPVRALRDHWKLTWQEGRVAALLARGRSNRQIAATLRLSPATTRHYTEALFVKLGVHTRAEAVAKILLV